MIPQFDVMFILANEEGKQLEKMSFNHFFFSPS
jgi:hypothetical protein